MKSTHRISGVILIIVLICSCQKKEVPIVTTTEITNITGTSAISGGTVISEGSGTITERGVCWSTTSNPTVAYVTKTIDGTGTGTFTSSIAGLTANTKYYVKAYATNTEGTRYGNEVTFTTNNTYIDKYALEIDNNYRIYKVSLSSFDWGRNFIIEYVYSAGSIQKTLTYSGEPGERISIYHINNSGLADTSLYWLDYNGERLSSSTSYYLYDSDNYLKMFISQSPGNKPDTTFYEYNNGNIIKSTFSGGIFGVIFPTSSTYTYNSNKNIIDIETFNGTFVGKLNQNLIESACDYGSLEGIQCRNYQYILNSNGLVEERKQIFGSGQTNEILIDKFEYKIR